MPWSDPKVRAKYHREYYLRNKERFYESNRRRMQANPEEFYKKQRAYVLRTAYGITPDDYAQMLREQDNKCAACGTDKPGGTGCFHVDHCHETGEVRALLCQKCNAAVGWYEKHGELVRAYLGKFGKKKRLTA